MHSVFSMRANSLTNLLAGKNRIDIGAAVNVEFSAGAVSYTHLTLPTICSV